MRLSVGPFFVVVSLPHYELCAASRVCALVRGRSQISLKTLMEISLVAGLVRTLLISWLCLYMIPRRLRALKKAEETLG